MNILRAYLVDDELLALKRLGKLLAANGLVEVIGTTTSPATALEFLQTEEVDILFLDIQMPGLNGFELLDKLGKQPLVIFTTAYDKYALKAFEVNSIDYLLKPVDPKQLNRALNKLKQLRETTQSLEFQKQFQTFITKFADKISQLPPETPNRLSFRIGNKLLFVDLDKITYFYAEDKVTVAATSEAKKYIAEYTIAELEEKLSSKGFVRIHRAVLVNVSFIHELHRWFGGRMRLRLKDKNQTELTVARTQVKILKARLGI